MTLRQIRHMISPFIVTGFLVPGFFSIHENLFATNATLIGSVTNAIGGAPVNGAKITVNTASSYSVSTGYYTLYISTPGTYTVSCSKPGFDSYTSSPITFQPGQVTTLYIALYETTNPCPYLNANLIAGNHVLLDWKAPVGNYELIYDDGVKDNFTMWSSGGNMNAVRFTPLAYPVSISGGSVNIGQMSDYPPGANPFVPFQISLMDANGSGGMPGTVICGPITVTPSAYGWVSFSFSNPVTMASGLFYVVMIQGGNAPNAAGLAIDETTPQYRSFSRFVTGNGPWLPASGNFMMRAVLAGPGGPPAFRNPENLLTYQVWRLRQGEESNPQAWTPVFSTSSTAGVDYSWPSLPCGPYRWAIQAEYPGNRWSGAVFSNVIGKCWTAHVSVDLSLSCSSYDPKGSLVQLKNLVYPDTVYSATLDSSGHVEFPEVWKGTYNFTARKFGYFDFNATYTITGNTDIQAVLQQRKSPPTNLKVDSLSLRSTWDVPYYIVPLLSEDWLGGSISGAGWNTNGGSNWMISISFGKPAPSAWFNWFPYTLNYEQSLVSPPVTGQNSPILTMKYDIFLDNFSSAKLDQMAVEISDGSSWQTLKVWNNAGGNIYWAHDELDISAYSGKTFQVRFRSFGQDSYYINGWYIDNIGIIASESSHLLAPCIYGYNYYLDNTLLATVVDNNFSIPGQNVKYDSGYTACVKAVYTSGNSDQICQPFTSRFLWPPRNLTGTAVETAAYLTWLKPGIPDTGGYITPQGLIGYQIFRDDSLIANIPGADTLHYYDLNLEPGNYSYKVNAVYDLTPYGHPGQQDKSLRSGPVNVFIHFGLSLPFYEPWDQASFSYHNWTFSPDQGNWNISTSEGNPLPSSVFTGLPQRTNYNYALISPALDATSYNCARIWLDFDVKLLDLNSTGQEKLTLDVYYNKTWHQKEEILNQGSTGWKHYHIDISAVKQKGFRFRFRASGASSADVLDWYIDNISAYAVCLPATNLTGITQKDDVYLSWRPPECNGGGMILNEGFEGQDFPPHDWERIITNTNSYWVHTGVSSPQGVHSGNYSAGVSWDYYHQDEWLIARNVFVNGNLRFWSFAYQGSAQGDHYFVKVSTDHGYSWVTHLDMSALPPYPGAGGYNHWQTPYTVDLSAYYGDVVDIAWHAVDGNGQGLWYYWAVDDCSVGGTKIPLLQTQPFYDIYRQNVYGSPDFMKINAQPVWDTVYTDTSLQSGYYKYFVQAGDTSCSQASTSDTILVDVVTGIPGHDGEHGLMVFPNPAMDMLALKSGEPVTSLRLVNELGKLIWEIPGKSQKELTFALPSVSPGFYILEVQTSREIRRVRLMIRQ